MNPLKTHFLNSLALAVSGLILAVASPLSVRAQDPGTTAFQQDVQSFATEFNGDVTLTHNFVFPAGQRLVIERLSLAVFVPKDARLEDVSLSTRLANNNSVLHELPRPTLQYTDEFGGRHYLLFIAPNLYGDGGLVLQTGSAHIVAIVSGKNAKDANGHASISGHLVCPGALTCVTRLTGLSKRDVENNEPITVSTAERTVPAQTRPRVVARTDREIVAQAREQ